MTPGAHIHCATMDTSSENIFYTWQSLTPCTTDSYVTRTSVIMCQLSAIIFTLTNNTAGERWNLLIIATKSQNSTLGNEVLYTASMANIILSKHFDPGTMPKWNKFTSQDSKGEKWVSRTLTNAVRSSNNQKATNSHHMPSYYCMQQMQPLQQCNHQHHH